MELEARWRRLCKKIAESSALADDAEGYRYLARFLAAGLRSCVTHDDPDYPQFQRMIEYATPWGLDHPDCLYLYAPLRGDASYTVQGNRGSANVLDLQVNGGHFSCGRVDGVRTQSILEGNDLVCEDDGAFTLKLVPRGDHCSEPNVLRMDPDARFLHIRQYFADWENELPADLIIERDDADWPIPPPSEALIERQLETLEDWVVKAARLWDGMSKRMLAMADNTIHCQRVDDEGEGGAAAGQVYGMGCFRCAEDEAVVIRMALPDCKHWNIALYNKYWECIEYASRQSSLNQHQAAGTTCVIAHRDPGVADWLDSGGLTHGSLSLRLYGARELPEVKLERVPLDRLPDLPRVDADERSSILTRRRHAVLRRFRT